VSTLPAHPQIVDIMIRDAAYKRDDQHSRGINKFLEKPKDQLNDGSFKIYVVALIEFEFEFGRLKLRVYNRDEILYPLALAGFNPGRRKRRAYKIAV